MTDELFEGFKELFISREREGERGIKINLLDEREISLYTSCILSSKCQSSCNKIGLLFPLSL